MKVDKVKCFDGAYAPVKAIVGYCNNSAHKGYISKGLATHHNCKGKGCFYYHQCSVRAQDIVQLNDVNVDAKNISEYQYKKFANNLAIKLQFPIIVVRVMKTKKYTDFNYCIEYVSASKTPDWNCYHSLAVEMGRLFGAKFFIHHLKHPDGTLVTTSEWLKMRK